MNKLHTNWKKLKIEDCAEVIGGGTPSTKKKEYWDGDISWITPKDLSNYNNRYISKGSRNISEKGLKYSSARLLPKNSVLLTTRAPIGYLAISKKELATNQGFKSLIMKNGNVPEFFYYLLKNNINKLLQYASGTTFMELNATNLKSIEFYIPEVKEQKRIASILSALDDKIELNNKTNKILEEMAQTIFKEWFINFNFPNEDGKPYKKSGGEMIDSELGKIPKGWKVGTIGDIAREVICGKTPPTKDKENYGSYMPFITIPDMHNNIYVVKTERYLSKKGVNTQSKKTIPKNSICVSCIATVGVVSLVSEYSQTNQQINSIIPKGKVSSYWVYFYIKNIKDMIINYASSGTTTLNLNKSQFEKIKIIIPSDNLFMSFNEIAKSLFDMIRNNQIENEKLSNIRDSLLPKLMTPKGHRADGEIRV